MSGCACTNGAGRLAERDDEGTLPRRAAWRLERAKRAERIEAELFARKMKGVFGDERDLGLALIRDGNGVRAFDTLLRYRGAAQAELFPTLR